MVGVLGAGGSAPVHAALLEVRPGIDRLEDQAAPAFAHNFQTAGGLAGLHGVVADHGQRQRRDEGAVIVAGGFHFGGAERKALGQLGSGNVPLPQGLHPEIHLVLGHAVVFLKIEVQAAHKVVRRVGVQRGLIVRVHRHRLAVDAGGLLRLGGGGVHRGHRAQQHRGVHGQRQRQTGDEVGRFFDVGVARQPRTGNQQHQRRQRQIHRLARRQQQTHGRQQRQLPEGQRPVAANGVQHQRREGKAQPQQHRIPAEGRRQMQRHGQQRGGGEQPLAKGGAAHRQRRQRRKQHKVGKPAQHQGGHKAQPQKIPHEHAQRAGKIQQRVGVGLQLLQHAVAVEPVGGGGEQLVDGLLPGEHRGVFVLNEPVDVMLPAVAGVHRHKAHLPVLRGEPVGPLTGHGEGLVDVVFFVRRGIGGQHQTVQQPETEHQHKNKAMHRQFFAQRRPHAEEQHAAGRQRHQQKEPGQEPADAPRVGDERDGGVLRLAVDGHFLVPQGGGGAVADGQPPRALVAGGQRHPITAALPALHGAVKSQAGVLPR